MSNDATVNTPSMAYNEMSPVWRKVQTVLNGTLAMRKARELYLPKYDKEGPKAYNARVQAAVLHNVTDLTLGSWVGRPFSDPVQIEDTVPGVMEAHLEDIDLQGNNITVFARQWFREGVAKAIAHVLVEMPNPPEKADGAERTKEDDLVEGIRPYWNFIAPENLIYATSTMVDSREVLIHVRIRENEIVPDGWGEKTIQRIRVIDRDLGTGIVSFEVWELVDEGTKEKWISVEGPTVMDIDVIPLVTFYADRTGLMTGKPPLEDLSDLNISHWQSYSDQRNILTVARFPILGATGISENETLIVLAPKTLIWSANENAKFFYIEHDGKAIEAGRQDLLDLEESMAEYGADFLRKRPGDTTATARALDSAEATSPLQDVTIRFNDALQQAMDITAKYLNLETVGTVSVATDFGPEEIVVGDLDALKEARRMRDISRDRYLQELRRRGVLSEEFDAEENEKELEGEDVDIFKGEPTDGEPIDEEADDDESKE